MEINRMSAIVYHSLKDISISFMLRSYAKFSVLKFNTLSLSKSS